MCEDRRSSSCNDLCFFDFFSFSRKKQFLRKNSLNKSTMRAGDKILSGVTMQYRIRSFIKFHGIFMGPGYDLGEGSVWKREEKPAPLWD